MEKRGTREVGLAEHSIWGLKRGVEGGAEKEGRWGKGCPGSGAAGPLEEEESQEVRIS